MSRVFIYVVAFLLVPISALADASFGLNSNRELQPSYEYEAARSISVPSGHFIKETSFEVVPYEIKTSTSYDETLKLFQTNLPATGFTLNTLNAKAGIITCVLQSDRPEEFVDMGITTRTYSMEEFLYPTAASTTYKLPYTNRTGDYYKVWRQTVLNCLATLQLKELNKHETMLTVSISYVFTLEIRYENTAFRKKAPTPESLTVNFITNMEQKVNLGNITEPVWVTPKSNGVLEKRLLNAAFEL